MTSTRPDLSQSTVSDEQGSSNLRQEAVSTQPEVGSLRKRASADKHDALARLAQEIAHDFNNLITSIMTNADALKARLDGNSDESEAIKSIRGEAARAASILRRLTSVSSETLLTEPVIQVQPAGDPCAKEARREEGRLSVLLAEDDEAVRRATAIALQRAGYDVTACATGEEAWEAFAEDPRGYDLLVTDLSMPALDGASLIQRVRLLHPRLRALLMSGYCDDRQAFDLVSSGKVAFLPKPFNTKEFLNSVRGQLETA